MRLTRWMIFTLAAILTALMLTVTAAAADSAPTSGVITGTGVRLRSGPGTKYAILAHYYKGDVLTVLEKGEEWVKVKDTDRDKTGYVSKDYFTYSKTSDAAVTKTAKAFTTDVTGSDLIAYAKKFLGVPYVWGGESPDGFDCSGFVQYVFAHFDITLPRTASTQANATSDAKISKSELEPGDLVFFRSPSVSSIEHVGIYIGDGKFIHSNSPGGSVRITSLSSSYYTKYYKTASKMFP